MQLYFYDSGEAFLEAYPMKIDILFLDIRMYQVSGMDIARHIRDMDEELCIIFISNMTQYALEGYRVHAFDFIVKPFDYPFFKKVFSLACRRIDRRKNETIHVKNDSGLFFSASQPHHICGDAGSQAAAPYGPKSCRLLYIHGPARKKAGGE